MKKELKKLIAVLLVAAMAVAMIGCGTAAPAESSKAEDTKAEDTKAEGESQAPAAEGTTTKTIVQMGSGDIEVEVTDIGKSGTFSYWSCFTGDSYDWDVTRVNAFNQAYESLGIKCEVQQVPDGAGISNGKLLSAIASGTGPDLLVTDSPVSAYQYAAEGSFIALDDILAEIDLSVDAFFQGCKDCMYYDGKCYLVPQDTNVILLYYRTDLVKEAGLDPENPPTTRDELDDWAEKLTVQEADGSYSRFGLIPWLDSGDDPFTIPYINGATPYADGKINLTDEAMVDYMTWVQSYAKKYDPDKINTFTSSLGGMFSPDHAFMKGQVAMTFTGNWFSEALRQYAPDVEYKVAPVPVNALGREKSTTFGCNVFAIPEGTDPEKAELAALFIKFCEQGTVNEDNFAQWRSIPVIDAAFDDVSHTKNGDAMYALEREIANSPLNGIPALCSVSAELAQKFQQLRGQIIHDTSLDPATVLGELETEMQMLLDSKN